ncbi:hypothetical protein ThrDRAFT_03686 [Frankia casuarinae]|nr:hypothetical protein CcI6DRAFT_04600 [Frankia sp. CcI6]EYT90690.1 hypothetical protein ThrDRAFT_03686 [Frankia casuarinae]OAA19749.1 hypothetical protein AAY23_11023 [Frankia casuarinae]
MREYIACDGGDDDWLCRCGNTPASSGFVPVRRRREVAPGAARWRGRYCCVDCGLLIHWPSREIVGRINPADLVLNDATPSVNRRRRPPFLRHSRGFRRARRARLPRQR